MRAVIFVFASVAWVGCAHRVAIESEPSGAHVYLNNTNLGMTPLWFDEPDSASAEFSLRLEKAGFETKDTTLLPVVTGGSNCLLTSPWRTRLPDRLFFQLYPAAITNSVN